MSSDMDQASRPQARVAVALAYEQDGASVPRVIAKGFGPVAERMLSTAAAAGVPVEQNATLARALSLLELEQAIPTELYKAVAQVIGFLMRQGRLAASHDR